MISTEEILRVLRETVRFSVTWAEVLVSGVASGVLQLRGVRIPLYIPPYTTVEMRWNTPKGMVYLILAGNLNTDTDHALEFEWILDGKTIYTDPDVVAAYYPIPMINPSIPSYEYAMARVRNKTDSTVYVSMHCVWLEASRRLFNMLMRVYLGTVWRVTTKGTPWEQMVLRG